MNIFVCDGHEALRRVEIPTPEPGRGEIRVKVACVGVCASDVEALAERRARHERYGYPVVGHELSGVVDAVGDGVAALRPGDRVSCIEGWGALADYVVTTPLNVLRFGERLPYEDGCLLEVLPGVAMASWRSGVTRESEVLVVGQGLSGLLISRLVHLHGCRSLTVVDPDSDKLAIASEFGADRTVVGQLPGVGEELRTEVPRGFDVVIVATPGCEPLEEAIPLTHERGRIVLYGGLAPDAHVDLYALHRRSISLVKEGGGIAGVREARRLWHEALQLVEDDLLPLARLRTHVLPMEEAERALRLRAEGAESALHVVLRNPWV